MRPIFFPLYYKIKHPKVSYDDIPYMYKRFVLGELWHLIRKGICQNIAPNCVLTPVRIALYRLCGFKIGKGCFIETGDKLISLKHYFVPFTIGVRVGSDAASDIYVNRVAGDERAAKSDMS